jgi:ABC-type branched-subunit amino acid transport system ATPase component
MSERRSKDGPKGPMEGGPDVAEVRAERAAWLTVEHLTVRYGGAVAVNDLSLDAPLGLLTGLIGPNGAGKTTTFNACSGLLRPSDGRILLFGSDITHVAPPARARLGLGRTFQRMELFDSLSVAQNVRLGREAAIAGRNPVQQLFSNPQQRRTIAAAVDEAIELCGLGDLAGRRAGSLSTGQRRLVELARALAGDFRFLLLDEPSSGLDRVETGGFGRILRQVVERRGIGILLVEHDMDLVMKVCDHIYVLDFGQLLFAGGPDAVRRSEVVQAAYLGSEAAVV